jgi:hypothetical protein
VHDFKPHAIVLPQNRPRSIERQGLDMDLGLQMWDKGDQRMHFRRCPPQNLTPKSMEELAEEVLGSNKIVEMFQAMAIVNMRMGNMCLEVMSFKTILKWKRGSKDCRNKSRRNNKDMKNIKNVC